MQAPGNRHPFWCTREQRGKAELLEAVGCPVGFLPDFSYASEERTVAAPARLFLFQRRRLRNHAAGWNHTGIRCFRGNPHRGFPEGASELEELLRFA